MNENAHFWIVYRQYFEQISIKNLQMALFPAYSSVDIKNNAAEERASEFISAKCPSQYTESQLLASDSEESQDDPAAKVARECVSAPLIHSNDDFFIDCKLDRGNLGVSTLYYPGRPQYESAFRRCAGEATEGRGRRYFTRRVPDPDENDVEERAAAYCKLLKDRPTDVVLWETYIDFQERCAGEVAALRAAEEAAFRAPRCGRVRARLLACLRAALSPHELLSRLRSMLETERERSARVSLWEALLDALGAERGVDAAQLTAAAAAALRDTPPDAAPRILHALGSYLRAAGLWERLVLLVELVVAMNYASAALPPSASLVAERRLLDLEDQALSSGLPLSAVWVRVERARAAAHWRPVTFSSTVDPQRVPLPHDVADLLLPVTVDDHLLHLSVRLLLLAKVPMLPSTNCWAVWAGNAGGAGGAGGGGESFLPLLWAGRSLPPAHPARSSPHLTRRLLALLVDPPHYLSDDTGFLSWVSALWEACCSRLAGRERVALVCWRLRWLQVLALAAAGDDAETTRLRAEGRALLRRLEPASPLPYAEWARLEWWAAGGVGAGAARALQAANRALRAALADSACPPHHALYVARVVCEVSAGAAGGGASDAGLAALVAAALGNDVSGVVTEDNRRSALERCERRCADIERELDAAEVRGDADEEPASCADLLLPGSGEWAWARSALAAPARRAQLTEFVYTAAATARASSAARYWEDAAEALATNARVAARLAPFFPHNAALAVAAAGAPLWAGPAAARGRMPRAGVGLFASTLPAWLAALKTDFAPAEAESLVRACRRSCAAPGASADEAALVWSARLEAEARAPRPRLPHALYAALDRAPQYKWLYVRGAAWCGGEAAVLSDALLERSLRLHALPAELDPPATCSPRQQHAG